MHSSQLLTAHKTWLKLLLSFCGLHASVENLQWYLFSYKARLFYSKQAAYANGVSCREEVGALCSESAGRPLVSPPRADALAVPRRDGAEDLLNALSAAYSAFPDLWLDPQLRCVRSSCRSAFVVQTPHICVCALAAAFCGSLQLPCCNASFRRGLKTVSCCSPRGQARSLASPVWSCGMLVGGMCWVNSWSTWRATRS